MPGLNGSTTRQPTGSSAANITGPLARSRQAYGQGETLSKTTDCGMRPSGVPRTATAVARRTAGRQIADPFGRISPIPDKKIGFREKGRLDCVRSSWRKRPGESQFVAWVGATCALLAPPVSCLGRCDRGVQLAPSKRSATHRHGFQFVIVLTPHRRPSPLGPANPTIRRTIHAAEVCQT